MRIQILILTIIVTIVCVGQTSPPTTITADSIASSLYTEGNYWKLTEIARQLALDSLSAKFHFHLGMSYAALSELQRAQELLKRSIALDSAKLQYRYQYARVLSQSGQYGEAVQQLNTCIAMDSNYIPARFQLGLTYAAQKNSPDEEAAVFSWLIDRNPRDFLSLYYLGEALKRSGYPDSASMYWRLSLSGNPRYVPALIALSNYLSSKKMYEAALPLYLMADSVRGGNKDLVFQIGECYRKLKDLPNAKLFFRRAIALDSMNGLYHAQLAYAFYSGDQYDSSIAEYKQAILYDDENAQYYLNLALVYAKMENASMVMWSYNNAVRVMHPEVTADVYYDLGTYCFQKKLWQDGINAYQRAIDINPDLVDAYYFKGSCHMELSEHQAALSLFTAFMHLTENNADKKGARYSAERMINYLKGLKKKK